MRLQRTAFHILTLAIHTIRQQQATIHQYQLRGDAPVKTEEKDIKAEGAEGDAAAISSSSSASSSSSSPTPLRVSSSGPLSGSVKSDGTSARARRAPRSWWT